MKILFIGMGNMGQAILKGMLKSGYNKDDISFTDNNRETINSVKNEFGVKDISKSSNFTWDIIIFAIKPQIFFNNDPDIEFIFKNNNIDSALIVSIMAGVTIENIIKKYKTTNVLRVMPNIAAICGESMSVITTNIKEHKMLKEVDKIFRAVGAVEYLDESYFDAVTALSGSGPAFVYTFLEGLIAGGLYSGLSYDTAKKLAIQTIVGSIKLLETEDSIEKMRHKVTSPAGTTIEGMRVLEDSSFRGIVMDAVINAFEKSKSLKNR